MNPYLYPFWITSAFSLCYLAAIGSALGQISPDGTVPTNVTKLGDAFKITGGAEAGSNLFHSFAEFSVPTGNTAHFNNTPNIENIISRVTGGSVSNIEGIIKANGIANLFLLNPNGIIFGTNAQLDIGGSFVASTASSLKFADGTEFSATASQTPPLLTMSVPIGLQFGATPGSIVNRSNASPEGATNSEGDPAGLQVQPGQTLALVGGNVMLEGGNLTAAGGKVEPGGRVELGSVAGNNFVSLMPTDQGWKLGYEGVQNFQDIQLSQLAIVDASGAGGTIQVQGRRVTLTDGSQIFNSTLGEKRAGNLTVTASEFVELIGTAELSGTFFPSGLFSQVDPGATGSGGNLTITTRRLIIRDGGLVSAGTRGDGQGGQLQVNTSESVELIGTGGNRPSAIESITVDVGAGGDLTINTRRLIVQDGAQIQASTLSEGKGGTLTVKASESVELIGTGTTKTGLEFLSSLSASSGIEDLPFTATGNGGDLTINTEQLTVRDGAEVSVSSIGSGNAGNLELTASSIFLDNKGKLTATTASGQGGNISLQGLDSLLLRRQSEISTSAGGTGDGGDITINSDIIALLEKSKITANAFEGRGGNIQITTQGLFVSPDSEITASSQLGIDGAIEINRPDVDPRSVLVRLPEKVVDVESLVAQGCEGSGNLASGEFTIAGRGGLPPSPNETVDLHGILVDLGSPSSSKITPNPPRPIENQEQSAVPSQPTDTPSKPIVEAQGWIIDADGKVVLTAQAPTVIPHSPELDPANKNSCNSP